MSLKRNRWAVFISGQGSNLQALLDAQPPIQIAQVISSRAEAFGVQRAQRAGVPVKVLAPEIDWVELQTFLVNEKIDFIFLAGFMRLLPESFVTLWPQRILNLHPSLLPDYKGLKAIEKSYADGAAMGATVHWVTADLDSGPIVLQKTLFKTGEAQASALSLDEVKVQMHQMENQMVVEAVRRVES